MVLISKNDPKIEALNFHIIALFISRLKTIEEKKEMIKYFTEEEPCSPSDNS